MSPQGPSDMVILYFALYVIIIFCLLCVYEYFVWYETVNKHTIQSI